MKNDKISMQTLDNTGYGMNFLPASEQDTSESWKIEKKTVSVVM